MDLLNLPATTKNPPELFHGDAWVDYLAVPQPGTDQRAVVTKVRFAPGARTAWHSHAHGQFLHVTDGVAWFGTRDGDVVEVRPGQTLYTPPGQEHWHAAADGCFMEHIALMESADDPADSVTWAEHVTDEQFHGPQA
ncbi:cupin domain-containing protein [Streptacidiphilus jiangxiensis]|uniref:Cupin domain protein n=1 Tax=Streptacidiphilus jiangxiensis TaxID=235985 RepID=A0A1H7ZC27_STRJI|nr:cupin domain-containing protein [Streptacidiphilus jiangxiensis]SEM56112.1 Cupin domain protein [Streptacidiphilus jiangxiensis]